MFKEIADNIYSRDVDMHKSFKAEDNNEIGVFPVIRSGFQSDLQLICNELGISNHSGSDAEWVLSKRNYNSIKWMENDMDPLQMPNVVGMTLRDALPLLENRGLNVVYRGKGRVTKQSITPGAGIKEGRKVVVDLG